MLLQKLQVNSRRKIKFLRSPTTFHCYGCRNKQIWVFFRLVFWCFYSGLLLIFFLEDVDCFSTHFSCMSKIFWIASSGRKNQGWRCRETWVLMKRFLELGSIFGVLRLADLRQRGRIQIWSIRVVNQKKRFRFFCYNSCHLLERTRRWNW